MNPQLEEFYEHLNEAVITTNDFATGTKFRKREKVSQFSYCGLNPIFRSYISLDLDRPGSAFSFEDLNLPPPTIITVNKQNSHCHYLYRLRTPVAFHENSRERPQQYFEAVEAAMTERLGADGAFTHTLTKNPLHPTRWHVLTHPTVFDLADFTQYVDLPKKTPKALPDAPYARGRNDSLFHSLRHWGYSAVHGLLNEEAWHIEVMEQALDINAAFAEPLPYTEVKATAKSVAKWIWKHKHTIRTPRERVLHFTAESPHQRMSMGAEYTNQIRSANAVKALKDAHASLTLQGLIVTPSLLQSHTGLNIKTVRKYFSHITACVL